MNKTTLPIVATTLVGLALASGCQSSGARFAWWNPSSLWNRSSDDATAVARSAPPLPSEQLASSKESGAPLADYGETSEEGASQLASSGAPAAEAPSSSSAVSDAKSEGMAPQSSPYSTAVAASSGAEDTSGTGLPGTESGSLNNSSESLAASGDRYSGDGYPNAPQQSGDRYGSPASSTPPATSTPPAGSESLAGSPAPSDSGRFDPYSRYSRPAETEPSPNATAAATPGAARSPDSSAGTGTAPSADESVATVDLPTAAGEYRPGGTSTYPTTQTSVNIASRPEGPDSQDSESPSPPSRYEEGGSRYQYR